LQGPKSKRACSTFGKQSKRADHSLTVHEGASNHIVELGVKERCRHDYPIERVHLEAAKIRQRFEEFTPGREAERGRVAEILGMSSSAARSIIRLALNEGLMSSPTDKGPLSLVFSSKTLESYFPNLYSLT
jgi:hypothetical protein